MTKREFVKTLGVLTSGASLTRMMSPQVAKAVAAALEEAPPILWLAGGTCGGCSISALNAMHPTIEEVITKRVSLHYHLNLSAASGEMAFEHIFDVMERAKGEYIYIQEGSIPTASDGRFCVVGEYRGERITMVEMSRRVAADARVVVAAGTCSCYGGIPSAPPNPTGVKPLGEIVPQTVVNVPGCPVHPDDLLGSLLYFLQHGPPELDEHGRPKVFFPNLHETCPLLPEFQKENFATNWGQPGKCTALLGCLGPSSHCAAGRRGWNNGVSGCVQSGSRCIGCTEPNFAKTQAGLFDLLVGEEF